MAKVKLDARKLSHLVVKGITRSSFLRELDKLNNKQVHAGITGEYALIMGVLNFGDPLHTVPNTPRRSTVRKEGKRLGSEGLETQEVKLSPIPARPFLTDAQVLGKDNIKKYINKNISKLGAGIVSGKSSQRALSANDFLKGLSEVMAENIRQNWRDSSMYEPNADMTIHNKPAGLPPLHGKKFNEEYIKGWVNE